MTTAATTRSASPARLRPPLRKLVLVLHVAVSVAALGIYIALLTLAIAGLSTDDVDVLRAAYVAMGLVADVLIIPISLAILATGLVLALGTRWGLARHYWVLTKFVLTLGLSIASIFGLRARIAEAIGDLPTGTGAEGVLLVILLPVAVAVYAVTTVLSIYKPWGPIRAGRAKS